jgi:hypothetical protein
MSQPSDLKRLESFTKPTCFNEPCPYCQIPLNVKFEFDPDLLPDQFECCVNRCHSSCCPYCGTPITMTIKKLPAKGYFIELAPPAPWCQLHITPPEVYLGQPCLPSIPRPEPQEQDPAMYSALMKLLIEKGYLTAQKSSDIYGLGWTGSLYWMRLCPGCQAATCIKFTPLPTAALLAEDHAYSDAQNRALREFLLEHCCRQVDNCLRCPSCKNLLAIQLLPLEQGGYYLGTWKEASPKELERFLLNKRLEFGESGEFFNEITLAQPSPGARDASFSQLSRSCV